MQAKPPTQNLQELQQKVEFAEHVKRITNQIHAASNLDQILLDLHKDILGLFDAEDLTLFAFDADKKEIFYKVPHIDTIEEVRIPITEQSLAGFCAKYLRPVNIADAYNIGRTARDSSRPQPRYLLRQTHGIQDQAGLDLSDRCRQ